MQEITAPICILVIVATGIFSFRAFTMPILIDRFLFDIEAILRYKQYYRIVTSALLHGGWGHLLFNMFSLYSFGSAIEESYGPIPFLIIYLTGIVGGSLLALIIHRNHQYRALGASGGVCGVIFASVFMFEGMSVQFFFVPVPIPAHIFAICFIVFSFFALRGGLGNIGHDAHLGGAMIGLLAAAAMYPAIVFAQPKLFAAVMGLSATGLIWMYMSPLHSKNTAYTVINPNANRKKKKTEPTIEPDPTDEEVLNKLLEKVSEHGIHSLTYVERQKLERISKKRESYR